MRGSSSAAAARSGVRTVAIVGGTHGNELQGIVLAKHIALGAKREAVRRHWPSLELRAVVANTEATKRCVRYVEEDLNRCFGLDRLGKDSSTLEARRAAEINADVGPKGTHSKTDYVLDLHNTNANSGVLLCFHKNDALSLELAGHLHRLDPSVRAALWDFDDPPYLPSLGRLGGMTVEMGPVAHGTLNVQLMTRLQRLLDDVLAYLHALNATTTTTPPKKVKHSMLIGRRVATVDFPRFPDGSLRGFIHPDLQGAAELQPNSYLRPGQPLFVDVDGNVVESFDASVFADKLVGVKGGAVGESPPRLYPLFTNEGAYYEKGTAFFLNRLEVREIDVLPLAAVAQHRAGVLGPHAKGQANGESGKL